MPLPTEGQMNWSDALDAYLEGAAAEATTAAVDAAERAESAAAQAEEITGLTGEDSAIASLLRDPDSESRNELDARYQASLPDQGAALVGFHTALARRATSPVDVLMMGHSFIEGFGVSSYQNRVSAQVVRQLRGRYQPAGVAGGAGYLGLLYSGAFPAPGSLTDYPVSGTGDVTQDQNNGLGRKAYPMNDASKKLTWSGLTMTGADVIFTGYVAGGTGYYKVDGGAAVTFSTLNSSGGFGDYHTLGGRVAQIRGLSAGVHTIEVGWSSGGAVFVDGLVVYNGDESKGIREWNGGKSSQESAHFDDPFNPAWSDTVARIQPALVGISFLCNDYYLGTPSAQSKVHLTNIIATIKSKCTRRPSFVLMAEFQRDTTGGSPVEPWSAYQQVYRDVAAEDPDHVCVFDLTERAFGPGPYDGATDLVLADKVHPNDAGDTAWADAFVGFVSPR